MSSFTGSCTHCHVLPAKLSYGRPQLQPEVFYYTKVPMQAALGMDHSLVQGPQPPALPGSLHVMCSSGLQQPGLHGRDVEDQETPHLSWSCPCPRGAPWKAELLPRQSKPSFLVHSQNNESWDLATLGQLLPDLQPHFFSHLTLMSTGYILGAGLRTKTKDKPIRSSWPGGNVQIAAETCSSVFRWLLQYQIHKVTHPPLV